MRDWTSPIEYFSDVIMRGPTLGCMFMCMAAALLGVIIYLKKQSLLGEALSHACYPGIMMAVVFVSLLDSQLSDMQIEIASVTGAFLSALLGLALVNVLKRFFSFKEDICLAFTLSSFFGLGILLASRLQFTNTSLYKKAQSYLFGQAATMTDNHIYLYALLAVITVLLIVLFFKEIQAVYFDESFARLVGIKVFFLNIAIFFLVLTVVVVGIRCVGVVLMSAMFVAPVVAARQITHRLSVLFLLSAVFGTTSGFLGNYLSLELSRELSLLYQRNLSIPTGPMVVLTSSFFALFALFFSPRQGLVMRAFRVLSFRYRCVFENITKTLLYLEKGSRDVDFLLLSKYQGVSRLFLYFVLASLRIKKHVYWENGFLLLTSKGRKKALRVLRLHRLWEVYLVRQLGMGQKRVHHNAEMIEHILTPELEEALTLLLDDPKFDPHLSPIPSIEETR
ncbi:Probable metal transport system membrane protein CPn_0347/CP_0413/CPj0347/CpB0354 [Chlamydiales bacterium SCGC AB-751-O23]|jgi:manganese/zinc/iron transport system permease protein|nr:Probable metal transport system membrane protein CPn_0347/CP_0413/CPj0347/CpB0354 [Chlamydiales bacterium SCGC AB-751-O23]